MRASLLADTHAAQPGGKHLQWAAHEHAILALDWGTGNIVTGAKNAVNIFITISITITIIVTTPAGAEDCRFKVWDPHGRLVHCSQVHVARHTSHGTRHTSHLTRLSPSNTP